MQCSFLLVKPVFWAFRHELFSSLDVGVLILWGRCFWTSGRIYFLRCTPLEKSLFLILEARSVLMLLLGSVGSIVGRLLCWLSFTSFFTSFSVAVLDHSSTSGLWASCVCICYIMFVFLASLCIISMLSLRRPLLSPWSSGWAGGLALASRSSSGLPPRPVVEGPLASGTGWL